MTYRDGEPEFMVMDYITITRDTRTGLVVAIGGDERAAGILQMAGFIPAPGPRGDYHRLPCSLPIAQQLSRSTAASHALLSAGFGVHLDPALNTLPTSGGDRQVARRYLARLAARARQATDDRQVAEILTEIAAPCEGLLPLVRNVLTHTWRPWWDRLDATGHSTEPAGDLMEITERLSSLTRQIEHVRNQAARRPSPVPIPPLPPPPSSERSRRR
ncbi:hypothetical protein ACLIYP_01405 [Streptomyces nanhaiensis]|uniref:hypothetical protein n=1 Tax=Streptomyces nanhaiensis TaxID=679319 RepID=UPI00399D05D6